VRTSSKLSFFILIVIGLTVGKPIGLSAETAVEKIGVILLHPKWSYPARTESWFKKIDKDKVFRKYQRKCGKGPWVCSEDEAVIGHERNDLSLLAIDLYEDGFLIESPHCAWSKPKKYSNTVDGSLRECVVPRVTLLKERGAEKIVVLGKSLGANAAIRAGVIIDGIDAIVAMAPGHRPEKTRMRDKHDADVRHARSQVKAGNGQLKSEYLDINQGREKMIEVAAVNYLSWFDPEGKAVMEKNAPEIKGNIAFLWIAGKQDMISDGTGKDIFDSVPVHAKSKFILVEGGHGDVREYGKDAILSWLKTL